MNGTGLAAVADEAAGRASADTQKRAGDGDPYPGIDRERPLEDRVHAVAEGRALRASGAGAAKVRSSFEPPRPTGWAL